MNLSNASNIRFNGYNIKTMKLDGVVLYNKNTNVIVSYTANASGVLPSFGDYEDYTVSENNNNDGTWTTVITKNSDTKPSIILFSGCSSLLNVHEIDTSKVTNMSGMFQSCNNLTSLDVSGFDTSNVTNMSGMFQSCNKLTSLDVSGFDTSNVTNMAYIFNGCRLLTSLDVSGFDTSNVTNMAYMFNACNNLTSLDVSGFNTSKVTNMSYMFNACSKLTSLDASGFDTSKVTNMSYMFYNCTMLTSLNSMTNIGADLTLPSMLNEESILDVIDNLATVTSTKTLKISTTQLSWISEDKIIEANNKGWTISA